MRDAHACAGASRRSAANARWPGHSPVHARDSARASARTIAPKSRYKSERGSRREGGGGFEPPAIFSSLSEAAAEEAPPSRGPSLFVEEKAPFSDSSGGSPKKPPFGSSPNAVSARAATTANAALEAAGGNAAPSAVFVVWKLPADAADPDAPPSPSPRPPPSAARSCRRTRNAPAVAETLLAASESFTPESEPFAPESEPFAPESESFAPEHSFTRNAPRPPARMAFATAASVCARTPACRSTAAVAASPASPPRGVVRREREPSAPSAPPPNPNPNPPPEPSPANRTSALRAPSVPGFTPLSAAANTHSAAARFASDVCFPGFPLSSAQIASSENGSHCSPGQCAPTHLAAPRTRAAVSASSSWTAE